MSMISTAGTDYMAGRFGMRAAGIAKNAKPSGSGAGAKKESAVEEYKKKHPADAAHVDKQLNAGRAVRLKNGVQNVSAEDMTMDAYKRYFKALLDTIPYDATRVHDVTTITITDAGWEQMKQDPDYEAWILGYFVEDRSVRNPFFGWGGNDGSFITEHFGASIEEHHGEGFSKSAPGSKRTNDEEESWWEKRHRRMQEFLEEQEEKAQLEAKNTREAVQQEFIRQQFESRQGLRSFFSLFESQNI